MSAEDSFEGFGEQQKEFVPAIFARSLAEAEEYRELLNDHDIPAIIGVDEDLEAQGAQRRKISRGVPVLVPDALLDEASEIIARREQADEFLGEEIEEEDEEEEEEGFELEEEGDQIELDEDEDDLEEEDEEELEDEEEDQDLSGDEEEEEDKDEEGF